MQQEGRTKMDRQALYSETAVQTMDMGNTRFACGHKREYSANPGPFIWKQM